MKIKLCIMAAAALLMIPFAQTSARAAMPVAKTAIELDGAGIEKAQYRRGGGHGMRARAGAMRPAIGRQGRHGFNRPGYRPGYRPGIAGPGFRPGRPGYRPGGYRPMVGYLHRPHRVRYWRPGVGWAVGSIVAVGVLSAAAAAAYAPPPPADGLCWFYTDPTYRAGYWAACN